MSEAEKVVIGGCTLHRGDCLTVLRGMAEASVDSVLTDPPAGISMMGKSWDGDKGGRDHWIAWMAEVAAECLRVAKPGAHALVWALPRTSHWTATAWEDAGWDVRDRVHFLHGVGFPKGQNVSAAIDKMLGAERKIIGRKRNNKADSGDQQYAALGVFKQSAWSDVTAPATPEAAKWQGWHTQLKPAVEDWWLLRKPLAEPTVAAQVLANGCGAINVDGCRVGTSKDVPASVGKARVRDGWAMQTPDEADGGFNPNLGRWPPNLVHDGSPEVLEAFAAFGPARSAGHYPSDSPGRDGATSFKPTQGALYADTGTAARFFPALGFGKDEVRFHYSAKANKRDRAGSKHPTIKPQNLLRWLARLITPPGGTILDPFAGSGSLGQAALAEGFGAVLIEREEEYFADCIARMEACQPPPDLLTGAAA